MDVSALACNSREISEGLEKAIWELLFLEVMHSNLDLEDNETKKAVSETLKKIAKDLEEEDE